ncbi:hypothetical protein [uncultured Aquitalea sp.]|nr:hypothetical protein [uncultured Aquitalea sp.]
MTLFLVSATLIAETLWLVLDKFWLAPEASARLSHYLPDIDHT